MPRRLLAPVAILALLAFAFAPTARGSAAASRNFHAHLSGDQEVPPRDTQAQGQANFFLSKDGKSLDYRVNVADIENVIAAHIHVGAAGVNGPVVAFLFGPATAGGGGFNGGLAEGTITAANLTGPLAGQPLSALIAEMEAGNTYANVHTNDGVDPTNTGPGDFPGGVVRGQIDLDLLPHS
jgi:hypothetical protein